MATSPNYHGSMDEFVLFSPRVYTSYKIYCVRFWYHFFGTSTGARFLFGFKNQRNLNNFTELWSRRVPQINGWSYAAVEFHPTGFYNYLIFRALLSKDDADNVGIDDIIFTSGQCPPTPLCDLESGLCGWSASDGLKLSNATPIRGDHTLSTSYGHYLVTQPGKTANLTGSLSKITNFKNDNVMCLKVWYQFVVPAGSSSSKSQFKVTVGQYTFGTITVSDSISDSTQNSWQMFSKTVLVSFYGKTSNITLLAVDDGQSQVAFDDIMLLDRRCETVPDCDFERGLSKQAIRSLLIPNFSTDFCGWSSYFTSFSSQSSLWLRNSGLSVSRLKKSPPYDTTTHTADGWYVMIPLEKMTHGSYYNRVLMSPIIDRSISCFSFFYWAQATRSTLHVLSVSVVDLRSRRSLAQAYVNATTVRDWTRFSMAIPHNAGKVQIQIIALGYTQITSDLALDDFSQSSIACYRDHHTVPPPPTPTPIPYKERMLNCNFNYLCAGWRPDKNWILTSYRQGRFDNILVCHKFSLSFFF